MIAPLCFLGQTYSEYLLTSFPVAPPVVPNIYHPVLPRLFPPLLLTLC